MADARSREVVFLSHCLLNQNTRYLGGARHPGTVAAAVMPYVDDGVGVVQMPCPEQEVWGGVLKRRFLWLLLHPRSTRLMLPLMPAAERYIRWRYRRLARRLAREVTDYTSSGIRVCEVVGVAGSPSCGVTSTMNLRRAAAATTDRPAGGISADWFNSQVVGPATCPGRGMFIDSLANELERHRQDVSFREAVL